MNANEKKNYNHASQNASNSLKEEYYNVPSSL
jgi:hypothetical protein